MKKYFVMLCVGFLLCHSKSNAQDSVGVELDILKAPSSPASNLLGFAVSDIDKPTDVSAFMVSLQSATSSFTKLPSNYAVDIAPFLLFKTKTDFTTNGLTSTKFSDYFKQTLVISFAISNPDSSTNGFSPNNTYGAIGFKFSLLRPQYCEDDLNRLRKIHSLHKSLIDRFNSDIHNVIEQDSAITSLSNKLTQMNQQELTRLLAAHSNDSSAALVALANEISDTSSQLYKSNLVIQNKIDSCKKIVLSNPDLKANKMDALDEVVKQFTGTRVGWNWDVAGGISTEFINRQFDNSRVFNGGLWTTFGYLSGDGNSFLFLARGLYNPDRIYALENAQNTIGNIVTFDAGARYVYSKPGSKFSGSVEAIYRSVLTKNTIDPSWRMILNLDYSIAKNQKINFSFGRNFDGTVTKDGNLVAALTLLAGFGNKR